MWQRSQRNSLHGKIWLSVIPCRTWRVPSSPRTDRFSLSHSRLTIWGMPGDVSVGAKSSEREADHSSSSSAHDTWSFSSTPSHLYGVGRKHRNDLRTLCRHYVDTHRERKRTPWFKALIETPTVADIFTEIPVLTRNPKVHYRARKIPSYVPIQIQMNPVHTIPPYFFNIHLNNILPSLWSSEWSFPFRLSNQNFIRISYFPHASRITSFVIWSRKLQIKELLIMQFSPASCHFIPLRSR
jgi:hypothetical protein